MGKGIGKFFKFTIFLKRKQIFCILKNIQEKNFFRIFKYINRFILTFYFKK